MKFEFSDSGTPYIQLDAGKLIFSKSTAHPYKGYKYVCYCGTETTSVCVSSAKAKNKKFAKVVEDINFTVRVKDFRRDDKKAFPTKHDLISNISLNFIKKLITENVVDEYLPFNRISLIAEQINMDDPTDNWDDDPDVDDNWDDDEDDEKQVVKSKLKKGNGKRKKPLKIKRTLTFSKVKPLKKG